MNEKTRLEYLSLAKCFLDTRFGGCPVNQRTIIDALKYCAPEYRPAYWRRLRRALALQQIEAGYERSAKKIAGTVNPVTAQSASVDLAAKKKPKQKRVKSVDRKDHKKLMAHLKDVEDGPCSAAVMLAFWLGCRPVEMSSIKLLGDNYVLIPSAKKTEDRGLDRTLVLNSSVYTMIEKLLPLLVHDDEGVTSDMNRIQRRLQRHVKRLWPARNHHISLYSYRHQLGSDLKASGKTSVEVATIMGHQNVNSVDVYGNRKSASRQVNIEVTSGIVGDVLIFEKRRRHLK